MDITKFFDRKKRELSIQSADGDDSKRPRKENNDSTSTPTSPADVFEESLKSGDCVKILVSCMQNIEEEVKELFLLSSNVKWNNQDNLSLFFFFLKKRFRAHKNTRQSYKFIRA